MLGVRRFDLEKCDMKINKPLKISQLAPPTTLSQERQEFAAVFLIAHSDLNDCIEGVNARSTDFWKRALFRSFFSFVELTSFRLRYLLLASSKDGTLELSPDEILILQEQVPELSDKGAVQLRNRFFTFEAYLRFTLNTYVKHFNVKEPPDFGGSGWEAIKRSVVIRNLLTHPRTIEHLFISEEELKDLNTAINWYFNSITQLIKEWNRE